MSKSITGQASETHHEHIEELIEDGAYDTKAEFVDFAVRYTLSEKHNR